MRFRAKAFNRPLDATAEATIKRGEEALPASLAILEDHLTGNRWIMGAEFSLVDCAYCPVLNVIEKSAFGLVEYRRVLAYLDASRARPTWAQTPRLPGL